MIIVHHLNNSRSQRVLWLLEELGLEYQIKPYKRDAKTMLAPGNSGTAMVSRWEHSAAAMRSRYILAGHARALTPPRRRPW